MHARPRSQEELTVDLRRDGADVKVRYFHAGRPLPVTARGPIPELIDPLAQALLEGRPVDVTASTTGRGQWTTGDALRRMLFPQTRRIADVIDHLGLDKGKRLPAFPMRLRVHCPDPLWAALPWSLTRYGQQSLAGADSGWTFEVAAAIRPARKAAGYHRLPRVAVLAPVVDALDPTRHIDRLHDRLCAANAAYRQPRTFVRVDSLAELAQICGGDGADVIYLFGHVEPGAVPAFVCGPDERIPFGQLMETVSAAGPSVLYINGCHAGGGQPSSAGVESSGRFPALIAPCTTIPADAAARLAERWFEHHLIGGLSPVEALYRAAPDDRVTTGTWALPLAFTAYGAWNHDRVGILRPDVAVRLDRFKQRSEAGTKVQELLDSKQRRVLALVSAGVTDNLVEELTGHLCQNLQATRRDWIIVRKRIDLLPDRTGLDAADPEEGWQPAELDFAVEGLERLVTDVVAVGEVPLLDALLHAIRDVPQARQAILWLDWGVYGDRAGLGCGVRPALMPDCSSDTFEAWLHFHRRLAARIDKRALTVVASIGFEKPADVIEDIEGFTHEFAAEGDPRFTAHFLPPLDVVKKHELLEFLQEDPNARVPDGYHRVITDALMDETGGRYHPLVTAIAEGERTGWARFTRNPPKKRKRRRW